jgi:predicted Zn-dependent protease
MRTRTIGASAFAAFLLAGTAAFPMGGGGGGGYGGGFGGSMGMGGQQTFDDYAVALRLIHHEEYAQAIPHLESALAQRPHDADILNYLGYTHRMVGDYQVSLDYYKRALAIDPDHKGVHEYLGELYLQMNDQPSAQKELETLASLCPSGCDERDALTKALAAYTPAATAGATTATPATVSTPAMAATPAATPSGSTPSAQ